ncbi:MAG: LysR family transcriptional regulator [Eggerthellaceae bacterium]|nr:LysR family transcriptional regulator [Eggerthellaceae bacterium]
MQLEHLREFVVFCESVNYTKAAKRLYIAQPTLIQHVSGLEKALGLSLVTHDGNPQITETGRLFCAEMTEVLHSYDEAIARCQRRNDEEMRQVRIANVRTTLDISFFTKKLGEDAPHYRFVDFDANSYDEFELLDKGVADFSLTFASRKHGGLFNGIDLNAYGFIPQPPLTVSVLMTRSHPLSRCDRITLDMLNGYSLTAADTMFYLRNSKSMELDLMERGVRTNTVYLPWDSGLVLVRSNPRYLSILNDRAIEFYETVMQDGSFVIRPLADDYQMRSNIIYRLDNPNPRVHEFAALWREWSAEADTD